MKNKLQSVFNFSDFRVFLARAYPQLKAGNSKISHRFISQKVGASSPGWFSNIIKGRINLTGTYIRSLAAVFKLENREADYFELLVHYNQAGSIKERDTVFEKLLDFKGSSSTLITKEKFEFYSKWYISVIRELLFTFEFKGDYKALAAMLDPPITGSQAKRAVSLLKKLGMVKKDAHGVLRPHESTLEKDANNPSDYWRLHMRARMLLAMEAIDKYDKSQRDISEILIPLSPESMEEAREHIKSLRKKLIRLSEKDKKSDTVYQCGFQLFPVTRPFSGSA